MEAVKSRGVPWGVRLYKKALPQDVLGLETMTSAHKQSVL